jgi:hypothetical protein
MMISEVGRLLMHSDVVVEHLSKKSQCYLSLVVSSWSGLQNFGSKYVVEVGEQHHEDQRISLVSEYLFKD